MTKTLTAAQLEMLREVALWKTKYFAQGRGKGVTLRGLEKLGLVTIGTTGSWLTETGKAAVAA